MHSVTSNAVYGAIGGKKISYKDVPYKISDLAFIEVTTDGRHFWYCSINKNTSFSNNQFIISATISYFSGISPLLVFFDNDGNYITFQYWDNHFRSGAEFKVRFLYIET